MYAERLRDDGVPVDLVVVPGMPHAADLVPGLAAAQKFRRSFVGAVAGALAEPVVERQSE